MSALLCPHQTISNDFLAQMWIVFLLRACVVACVHRMCEHTYIIQGLSEYVNSLNKPLSARPILGFRPTGWTHSGAKCLELIKPTTSGRIAVYGDPPHNPLHFNIGRHRQ